MQFTETSTEMKDIILNIKLETNSKSLITYTNLLLKEFINQRTYTFKAAWLKLYFFLDKEEGNLNFYFYLDQGGMGLAAEIKN